MPDELLERRRRLLEDQINRLRDLLPELRGAADLTKNIPRRAELENVIGEMLEHIAKLEMLLEGLQSPPESGHNHIVNQAQLRERGHDVAIGKAEISGHPVRLAIVKSKWKTLGKYAERRLGIDQTTLSKYLNPLAVNVPPKEVADKVKADFGFGDDAWPRPPRR